MKINKKIQARNMFRLCLLALLLPVAGSAYAQVKIGNSNEPRKGTLLDLEADTLGVLFPKVNLVEYNKLEPLITGATIEDQKGSIGMVVYNTNEQADGVAVGFVVWNGDEWQSLTGGGASMSKVSSVDCSGIQVKGTYLKNKPLDDKINTIILPVNVDRKGSYNILIEAYQGANPIVSNEYVFATSGEFYTTGIVPVTVGGQGIPKAATVNDVKDVLKIYINGQEITCPNDGVRVDEKQPDYSFKCEHVTFYISDCVPGHVMNPDNDYISVRVTAPMDAAGAYWHITTNTVNGVYFEGSGVLKGGTENLLLDGVGKIDKHGTFSYTITSNNLSGQTCTVDMNVAYNQTVKILTFSEGDGATGNHSLSGAQRAPVLIAKNSRFFGTGTDAKVAINSSNILFNHATTLNNSPDYTGVALVLLGYNANVSDTEIPRLVNYIKNDRGVAFLCSEGNNTTWENIVKAFSPGSTIRAGQNPTSGTNTPLIPLLGNSPAVRGAYLDLSNAYITTHGNDNGSFSNVPSDWEVVAGSSSTPRVIKHKNYDIYISGDGGTLFGGSGSNEDPTRVDANGNPQLSQGVNGKAGASNSHLLANLMIYAIQKYISNH